MKLLFCFTPQFFLVSSEMTIFRLTKMQKKINFFLKKEKREKNKKKYKKRQKNKEQRTKKTAARSHSDLNAFLVDLWTRRPRHTRLSNLATEAKWLSTLCKRQIELMKRRFCILNSVSEL